ncbi:MAG TPA: MlaD family protein [Gammaproteobacteria bacterium]|jgi:phospholipid/cholesterol/gamma-HCH transport system substrate-binding protein|nr:MlaD family protein [Gammaproteobacteria bacterium]
MENRSHAIIAVSFLIVFSIAAILVYYWLSHTQSEPKIYQIVTNQSVGGLQVQSEVSFKGLEVGRVQSVKFDPQDPSKVVITISVRQETYVTHATYAELQLQGITGQKSLALKLGPGSRQPLKTNPDNPATIPLHPNLLAELEETGQQDLKKINNILANAQKVLSDTNRRHLTATIRQIDTATRQVVEMEKQMMPVIRMLPDLVKSAQQSLDQSHALLAEATALAKSAKAPVHKAGQAAEALRNLSESGERLTLKLEHQTLPDIDTLADNLTRTAKSLDELSKELQTKPQSLIFGPPKPPPGPGEPGYHGNGSPPHE